MCLPMTQYFEIRRFEANGAGNDLQSCFFFQVRLHHDHYIIIIASFHAFHYIMNFITS